MSALHLFRSHHRPRRQTPIHTNIHLADAFFPDKTTYGKRINNEAWDSNPWLSASEAGGVTATLRNHKSLCLLHLWRPLNLFHINHVNYNLIYLPGVGFEPNGDYCPTSEGFMWSRRSASASNHSLSTNQIDWYYDTRTWVFQGF